jgi:hypothetical protein
MLLTHNHPGIKVIPAGEKAAPQGGQSSASQNLKKEDIHMKKLLACAVILAIFSTAALAGPAQYQVTGPVLEVRDDAIVVQKGNEKWEISRDKDTKVMGDLKVGSKVTIYYTMTAAKVEVKEAPKKK